MPEKDLEITEVPGGNGERLLRLNGPLLLSNFFPFQKLVREDQSPSLVIDMTDVPYIDSAGIGALVGVHVHRQRDGRALLLVGVTDRVRTSLQLTKVDTLFKFGEATAGRSSA